MKKILALAGSNSSSSINHQLVNYTASLFENHDVTVIKLTDYPLPIFGEDIEREEGYPETLQKLLTIIQSHDAIILAVNEHNGTVSAYFKNVLDWLSRIEYKFLKEKPVLLMSTSPGKRGALTALQYVEMVLPRFDATAITTFVFPSFSENFSNGVISNEELNTELVQKVGSFTATL